MYYIPCPDIPRLSFCHAEPDDPVLTTKQEKESFVVIDNIRGTNYTTEKIFLNEVTLRIKEAGKTATRIDDERKKSR